MSTPYKEIMKYHNHPEMKMIYDYPTFVDEYTMISSIVMSETKILDFGCGTGKFYNEKLLPSGFMGEYVGIDPDPSLKSIVNFKLYSSIEEFLDAGYNLRYFDMLIMLNSAEHLSLEELYNALKKLNPYIDGNLIIMTPNSKCLDYLFADPTHITFYAYDVLYGIFKHFSFDEIQIWRGKGIYQIREAALKDDPNQIHLREMNEFQRRVCLAMGLDWYGNILLIGERSEN